MFLLPLFASQLLFDVVVYSLGKVALSPKGRIALVQNVILDEPSRSFWPSLAWHPVFVDGPFGQRDVVQVTFGDQSAQYS
jgi:hypothetical protein